MALKITAMISEEYRHKYPAVSKLPDKHVEETLAYYDFPEKHRRKIRTTNLLEGTLNSILKRRSKVVGIFPNRESCLRYACRLLMEIAEDWQTGRKYMKMEERSVEEPKYLFKVIKQVKLAVELVIQ